MKNKFNTNSNTNFFLDLPFPETFFEENGGQKHSTSEI